jgi:hypothetical protein
VPTSAVKGRLREFPVRRFHATLTPVDDQPSSHALTPPPTLPAMISAYDVIIPPTMARALALAEQALEIRYRHHRKVLAERPNDPAAQAACKLDIESGYMILRIRRTAEQFAARFPNGFPAPPAPASAPPANPNPDPCEHAIKSPAPAPEPPPSPSHLSHMSHSSLLPHSSDLSDLSDLSDSSSTSPPPPSPNTAPDADPPVAQPLRAAHAPSADTPLPSPTRSVSSDTSPRAPSPNTRADADPPSPISCLSCVSWIRNAFLSSSDPCNTSPPPPSPHNSPDSAPPVMQPSRSPHTSPDAHPPSPISSLSCVSWLPSSDSPSPHAVTSPNPAWRLRALAVNSSFWSAAPLRRTCAFLLACRPFAELLSALFLALIARVRSAATPVALPPPHVSHLSHVFHRYLLLDPRPRDAARVLLPP